MADNKRTQRADTRTFSIGFLTALTTDELVPCEDELEACGWSRIEASEGLAVAGIGVWEKTISGTAIRAYSSAIDDMGQTASAIETSVFLKRCNPTDIYLVGIAGSLQKDWIFRRDVVVGRSVHWETQNGVSGDRGDKYRMRLHDLPKYDEDENKRLAQFIARNCANRPRTSEADQVIHTHFGSIFSWDYVVDSQFVVDRIVGDLCPTALCVEMEAGGFLAAISRHIAVYAKEYPRQERVFARVVRGISDYAHRKGWDENARTGASKNAMRMAIKLAEWQLANRLGISQ